MKDYDTNVSCSECNLAWTMTSGCGGVYCPYCGKEQIKSTKDYLYIRDGMERDLKEGYVKDKNNGYYYYWGMIDYASNKKYITYAETSRLRTLREKFRKVDED